MQTQPSKIAASCIAAARLSLYIQPIWSEELERVTTYKVREINFYAQQLLWAHKLTKEGNSDDSGHARSYKDGSVLTSDSESDEEFDSNQSRSSDTSVESVTDSPSPLLKRKKICNRSEF